jgi:hypothetical protein
MSGVTSNQPESQSNGRASLGFGFHSLLILLVVAVPVVVYEQVSQIGMGRQGTTDLSLVGGVTYPLYAIYWISRLKSVGLKATLIHLITVLTATFLVGEMYTHPSDWSEVQAGVPMLLSGAGLALALFARLGQRRTLAKALFISTLVTLPVAMGGSLLLLIGQGMSAMAGMRW